MFIHVIGIVCLYAYVAHVAKGSLIKTLTNGEIIPIRYRRKIG